MSSVEQAPPNRFAANVAAQGLARVLSIAANLVLVLAVARLAGTETFGRFSYVLAFIAVATSLADLGTTAVLARGLSLVQGARRSNYLGNFVLIRGAMAGVVMLGCLGFSVWTTNEVRTALLIVALGMPVLASRFFEPIYQVAERPWLSLWPNLGFGLTQLGVAGVIAANPTISVTALTALFVGSNAVYAVMAVQLMFRYVRPDWRPNRALLRDILSVAAPMGVGALFTTLAIRMDVFVLERMWGVETLGYYSAAYKILDLAVFVTVTLVTPLIPILSREIQTSRAAALARSRIFVQFSLASALPLAIIVPSISTELITFIFGASYAQAGPILSILVWDVLLVALALIGTAVNLANGVVNHSYWVAPLGAVVAGALNLYLVPRHGAVGAAWAALGTQAVMLACSNYYTITRFGNVYEARTSLRVLACCVVLTGVLWSLQPLGAVTAAGLALAIYIALALASSSLPVAPVWRALLEARAARPRTAN